LIWDRVTSDIACAKIKERQPVRGLSSKGHACVAAEPFRLPPHPLNATTITRINRKTVAPDVKTGKISVAIQGDRG